jgi:hypothetical protein
VGSAQLGEQEQARLDPGQVLLPKKVIGLKLLAIGFRVPIIAPKRRRNSALERINRLGVLSA